MRPIHLYQVIHHVSHLSPGLPSRPRIDRQTALPALPNPIRSRSVHSAAAGSREARRAAGQQLPALRAPDADGREGVQNVVVADAGHREPDGLAVRCAALGAGVRAGRRPAVRAREEQLEAAQAECAGGQGAGLVRTQM